MPITLLKRTWRYLNEKRFYDWLHFPVNITNTFFTEFFRVNAPSLLIKAKNHVLGICKDYKLKKVKLYITLYLNLILKPRELLQ